MRVALYLRVSTGEQTTENQRLELTRVATARGWTVVASYVDEGISGAKGRVERPGFDSLYKAATRRECDVVMAWSVDRLSRSLSDLIDFMTHLQRAGVQLYLHQQALDTTTPAGMLMFQISGAFAQYEREIIRARINTGVARAKAQGKKWGQKTILMPELVTKVMALHAKKLTSNEIAHELKIGQRTVFRALKLGRSNSWE